MAEEKIKNIIAAILERPEYLLDTPRNTSTRRTASELLESIKGEPNQKIFNHFVTELVKTISKVFPAILPKKYATEKVLSHFHFIVFNEVEKVWERLYQDIQTEVTRDMMMKQFTNDKIFHEMYVSHFAVTDSRALYLQMVALL